MQIECVHLLRKLQLMPAFAAKLKTALCTFKTIKFVKVESVPLTLTHYGVMIFVVVYVLTFQVLSLSTTSGCNGGASERASERTHRRENSCESETDDHHYRAPGSTPTLLTSPPLSLSLSSSLHTTQHTIIFISAPTRESLLSHLLPPSLPHRSLGSACRRRDTT